MITTNTRYDVCAIGNALVDIISDSSDQFLVEQNITKGSMTLIDAHRATELYRLIGPAVEMSGGSAANTSAGLASLGATPAYMGKVRDDQFGTIFRHDLSAQGVHFSTSPTSDSIPTGRCIILVTSDAQRSMNTYLGAAVEFSPQDIEASIIQQSQVIYLEGYLYDKPLAQEAFRHAASIARANHRRIALTLSDVFCVERHRDSFLKFIKNDVDILFANQNEILSLYQCTDLKTAIEHVRKDCEIAVITRSELGAEIITATTTHHVSASPVKQVVDTTGAGDLFAAGFLFGFTKDKPLEEAGRIGAIAAAEVISHYGPRPQKKLITLL
jgi:sugar/nucleoside kinase (ribokinase family)